MSLSTHSNKLSATIGTLVLLSGCKNEPQNSNSNSASSSQESSVSRPLNQAQAARYLHQTQFHSNDTDVNTLMSMSYADFFELQYNTPPSSPTLDWINSKGYNVIDSNGFYNQMYPFDYAISRDLILAQDGLRKKIALALSEFFVIGVQSLEYPWRAQSAASWWDMLNRNAFGNFRSLLEQVTLHPAMGYFLNTKGNRKENNATGRLPDENYAREVLQLFSIGLYELNLDGSHKLRDGKPIETYTQSDIANLARVFTGWDFDLTQNTFTPNGGDQVPSQRFAIVPMLLTESNHSSLEAQFLGSTIPANTPGMTALSRAMDIIFNHSNVGPFFCEQMIQRLVTSNPTSQYIARVASVFNDNGRGVRGDLKSVFKAIFLDPEARQDQPVEYFGKLKEPMIRIFQWARTFNVRSIRDSWKLYELQSFIGQSPLKSPSVFNFYRPGYVPSGTSWPSWMLGPEFQITNETTTAGYVNAIYNIVRDGIYITGADNNIAWKNGVNGFDLAPNYEPWFNIMHETDRFLDSLNLHLCANRLTSSNRSLIRNVLLSFNITANSNLEFKKNAMASVLLLILCSPEFLIEE